MLSGKPKTVFNSLSNTLEILRESGLVSFYNYIKIEQTTESIRISWPNHISGYAKPMQFNKINTYLHMLNNGSYTCLLFDGSIIRIAYTFSGERLESYNFLWWPSPFPIVNENEEYSPSELFSLYLDDDNWHYNIEMRSPIRFDYDYSIDTELHPCSHIHTQDSECRIKVSHPVCFNRFFKFIFSNFYSQIYYSYDFWDDLELLSFYSYHRNIVEESRPSLGWLPTTPYSTS